MIHLHLVCWLVILESRVHYQFLSVEVSFLISIGTTNYDNNFWNKIFYNYICRAIGDYGIYIVSENVFLWAYVWSFRVINYYYGPIIVKSNALWGLNSWGEYVAYPIFWNYTAEKRYVLSMAFGRLLYCLPTVFTWFWDLSPIYTLFFEK